jgi:hypothetical protein
MRSGPVSAASAASRSTGSGGMRTCGVVGRTGMPSGMPPAWSPGTCGWRQAIMPVSSSAYSKGAAPRPAGGYGRPPRSITGSRCSGYGANTATRSGHHCLASGAHQTCRSSIATCIWDGPVAWPRTAPGGRSIADRRFDPWPRSHSQRCPLWLDPMAVSGVVIVATKFYRSAEKSVCTNWTSGTLTLLTMAKIAKSTRQSNPMLIPSDGSSFACCSKRISLDVATLVVTEDMPTLAQPTKVECGAVHNKAPLHRPVRNRQNGPSGAPIHTRFQRGVCYDAHWIDGLKPLLPSAKLPLLPADRLRGATPAHRVLSNLACARESRLEEP